MFVCWNPFVDCEIDVAVRRGQRMKGDHPAVQRHADCFVSDGELIPDVRSVAAAREPTPEPIGRVKLRVLPLPGHSERRFEPQVSPQEAAQSVGPQSRRRQGELRPLRPSNPPRGPLGPRSLGRPQLVPGSLTPPLQPSDTATDVAGVVSP
jgi:hypothetical protein